MRMGGLPAVASALRSPNFEEVLEIGAEEDIEPQAPANAVVVLDADALVADPLPKELGSLENRVPRQPIMFTKRYIWIGQSTERAALSSCMAELREAVACPRSATRNATGSAYRVEQPLCRVLDGSDIAIAVEHGESIAVLQGAQRTIDQGRVRLDVVFGPDVRVAGFRVASGSRGVHHVASCSDHVGDHAVGESRIAFEPSRFR